MTDLYGETPDPTALHAHLSQLKRQYGHRLQLFPIGRSALGNEILAVGVGNIRGATLFVGGIGAQEWNTTRLLTRFIEQLIGCMKEGESLASIDVRRAMVGRSLMVIPCLNPDGIDLAAHGSVGSDPLAEAVGRLSDGCLEGWQANARGVDLRLAFDAGWHRRGTPSAEGFSGTRPMSEPECRAAVHFCSAFAMKQLLVFANGSRTIAYRFGEGAPRARLIAQVLAGACNGKVLESAGAGGLKDWFIQTFSRPAFEIGIGAGSSEELWAELSEMMVLSLLI